MTGVRRALATRHLCIQLGLWLGLSLWLGCAPTRAMADDLHLRLHVAWGGGVERQWSGRLVLTAGSLQDLRLLGTDSEVPGTILQQGQQVLVQQWHPKSYDGLEFSVRGPADANLQVELLAQGESTARVISLPLASLLGDGRSESLDDQQNRLVVRRAPGDLLRVQTSRDHLVYAPGEEIAWQLQGYHLGVPAGTLLRGHVQLTRAGSSEILWEGELREKASADGDLNWPAVMRLAAPDAEGVYDLVASIHHRRRSAAFGNEKLLVKRRVQFVVVDGRAAREPEVASEAGAKAGAEDRTLVLELNPAEGPGRPRVARLPQWSRLAGLRGEAALSNLKTETVRSGDRDWAKVPIQGWLAYSLPVEDVNELHELEVDLPGNLPQSLGVSIVEPNAAGKVVPVGLDSGVKQTEQDVRGVALRVPEVVTHRLPFWPRTESPLVLLTNLDAEQPAQFGKLRLYRRSAWNPSSSAQPGRRLAFAVFERPLFPEAFHAAEGLDEETGRSLEDWRSFWNGGERMVDYARHVGYDGLAVMVASEGSSLYPSHLLQPSPKHDRGIFFVDGRDPLRKDVLEMLFRLCDRENLKLVSMLEFASPLPELERRLKDPDEPPGITLVDGEGVSWRERQPGERTRGAYYNPLDARVQDAMLHVVAELVARYSHHPSFAGVTISMTPDGFSQLPGEDWGGDARTVGEFAAQKGLQLPAERSAWPAATRDAWLDWRCERLANLYRDMALLVSGKRPDATLYLAGARLAQSPSVQRVMRPALPRQSDIADALRELGIAPARLHATPNLLLLRPQLLGATSVSPATVAIHEFNESPETTEAFADPRASGAYLLHDPTLLRLESFDQLSPFGRENTLMSLAAQVTPAGTANRRRFGQALAQLDAQVIFEGGWMVPLGQEESIRDFLRVYRQLPAAAFREVTREPTRWQPLRVRSLRSEHATCLYLVNDSPWVVGGIVRLTLPLGAQLTVLTPRGSEPLPAKGEQAEWNVTLQPYEVVAVTADRASVEIRDIEVNLPPDVRPALESLVQKLGNRVARLRQPSPLPGLVNAGFEAWNAEALTPEGWSVEGDGVGVKRETQDVHEGKKALRLEDASRTVVLLSSAIQPPASGRLSIAVRAKAPREGEQPRVRLVLEVDGKAYYPWSRIGAEAADRSLDSTWKEFVFRVNQLPVVRESLRIGVEMEGNGPLLLDDIRLFDTMILDDEEQKALALMLTVLDYQRRNGLVSDCLQSLNGYWPQYLMQEGGESETVPAARPAAPNPPPAAREASTWSRWKRLTPTR